MSLIDSTGGGGTGVGAGIPRANAAESDDLDGRDVGGKEGEK